MWEWFPFSFLWEGFLLSLPPMETTFFSLFFLLQFRPLWQQGSPTLPRHSCPILNFWLWKPHFAPPGAGSGPPALLSDIPWRHHRPCHPHRDSSAEGVAKPTKVSHTDQWKLLAWGKGEELAPVPRLMVEKHSPREISCGKGFVWPQEHLKIND